MKTGVWLRVTLLPLWGGCAPGYYASGPEYEPPAPVMSGMTYQNPETPEQEQLRIWRESMGR
jgi:hypothetical protein